MDQWYKIVTPRQEVREGRWFGPDEVAIALEQALLGTGQTSHNRSVRFAAVEET